MNTSHLVSHLIIQKTQNNNLFVNMMTVENCSNKSLPTKNTRGLIPEKNPSYATVLAAPPDLLK